MIQLQNPPPRLAVLLFGLFVGITAIAVPLAQRLSDDAKAQQTRFGEALVQAAAREAMDPAFRQDLISLRVIVENLANNNGVYQASIHNVEGRVLVQAGESDSSESITTYQSSINLHDSVAGLVSISTHPSDWGSAFNTTAYIIFACLCLLLAITLCIRARVLLITLPANPIHTEHADNGSRIGKNEGNQATRAKLDEKTRADHDNDAHAQTYDNSDAMEDEIRVRESKPHESRSAYTALCVKNVAVLKQQLNGETFRKTFNALEAKLNAISRLYGASTCQWHRDRYLIHFKANTEQDALFNAACAAQLMFDLAAVTNRIPLDLSAQVAVTQDLSENEPMPYVGVAVHTASDEAEQLSEKIKFIELSEHDLSRMLVSEFAAPYDALLKKQHDHLLSQL